jgi:hypothetical protein
LKQIIEESIISNSDVYITEQEEKCMVEKHGKITEGVSYHYEPKGQEIEVALIRFLVDNKKDLHEEIVNRNKNSPKLCQLPFD